MGPREVWRRLRAMVRYQPMEDDLAEELEAHLELATQDYVSRGMGEREARRAALIDLGGVQQAKELHREHRGLPALEQLWHDLRLAARSLRRDSQLTAFSVSIIALGVAASTLVFSVGTALLVRPLPFQDPERLVWVANGEASNLSAQTIQVNNLLDLRQNSRALADMAGFNAFYGPGDIHLGDDQAPPQRTTGVPITEGLLSLLGVEPLLGREFTHREVVGREPVALLGHRLWQTRYGGDSRILGRTIRLDGKPTTVVGVLPEAFDFERILTPGRGADLFLPFALDAQTNRRGNTLAVIGRLAPGLDVDSAQNELSALAADINAKAGDVERRGAERRNSVRPRLIPLHERISGNTRSSLLLLGGAVGMLMLIVCANLSNLLLARVTTRRKEMALHTALGAGRGRLVRKLMCESLLLSGFGTVVGVLLASFGAHRISQMKSSTIPLLHQVQIDAWVVLFAGGLATTIGLFFGLLPALQASATAPSEAIRGETRSTGSIAAGRVRQALVVSEIALACVLLVGVGLFLRSFLEAMSTELGFETENIVGLRVDLPRGMVESEERLARYDELLAAVRGVPQVLSAGVTDALPLGDNFGWRSWNTRADHWDRDADGAKPLVRIVDDGYWQTLELRLLAGRTIEAGDRSRPGEKGKEPAAHDRVVVINETLAEVLWPEAQSLSEVLSRSLVTSGRQYRVVGVVSEARYFSLEKPSGPEMYFSFRQVADVSSVDLVMRTRGNPDDALPAIRRALAAAAPGLPLTEPFTMDGLVDRATYRRRAVLGVLSGFGGFGLLLAVLGVYSVIAYTVAQSRRSIGVRMAFGATGEQVSRELVRRMLKPITWGTVAGLVLASWLAEMAANQLYGVSPGDPLTFGSAALGLVASGLAAAYFPAKRAARLEVVEILREH